MAYLILMVIALSLSVYLIRKSPRIGKNYYDAGLFIVLPSSIAIILLLTFSVVGVDLLIIKDHWRVFQNIQTLYGVSLLHALLIFSFSLSYFLFNKTFQKQSFITNEELIQDHVCTNIYKRSWFYIFILLSIIFYYFIARYSNDTNYDNGAVLQLKNLGAKMWGFSVPVILYLIVKNSKTVIIKLAVIVFIIAILNFYILGSKGGLIWFLITASILETLKFRGNLINLPLFILTFLGGGVIFSLFNVIESFYYGNGSWIYMMQIFEYQVFENNANIIHSVDTGNTELRLGSTYIDSLFKFLPSILRPYEITTLGNWYLDEFLPGKRAEGFGAGFGAISEGYLNFGVLGVAFEGFVIGFIASIMRIIRFRNGLIGALVYASFVANGYKFFRIDIGSIVFKQVFDIFSILLLFIFVYIFINFFRSVTKKS
jgi:oligosaccharide repeat unit polymerase